jgi:hypothetical protein
MSAKAVFTNIGVRLILGKRLKFEGLGEIREFFSCNRASRGSEQMRAQCRTEYRLYNKDIITIKAGPSQIVRV